MGRKLLFVFNPKAGKGQIKTSLLDIIDIFNKHGFEVIAHVTQAPRDAYEMVRKYESSVDMIICSGGDGTLDEVVTGIMEMNSQTPVGYIPAGSTNDFANSLFMPKSMTATAENIMEQIIYKCDVGSLNEHTFIYVAAFGIFTDVSYLTSQDMKNAFGHAAYIMEGVKSLFDVKSYHIKVEADEHSIEGDFIYGMVTNSRLVGGFKNLTGKDVDMDDGLFEVTLIKRPANPLEIQKIMSGLLSQEETADLFYTFKTGHIKFVSDEPLPWTLDGEYGGDHAVAEIENKHKALNLLLRSTKEDEWTN